MTDGLLWQGLLVMLYGIGTVFVFLLALMAAMVAMGALLRRLGLADAARPAAVPGREQLHAAIRRAIQQHRLR